MESAVAHRGKTGAKQAIFFFDIMYTIIQKYELEIICIQGSEKY
jgi:hypothetical protein